MIKIEMIKGKTGFKSESGASLVAAAFLLVVLGFGVIVASHFYRLWQEYETRQKTESGLLEIQERLAWFLTENGRYPCPASLRAGLDTPEFGAETDCGPTSTLAAGTFEAAGRDGLPVRTGAVPVRTLGLPDEMIADGYKHRYVYAVTRDYAYTDATTTIPSGEFGDISVQDPAGNHATSAPGNLVQTVFSVGWDTNGAYHLNGGDPISPCDTDIALSGENCNYYSDAVFVNTVNKSANENEPFQMRITYRPTNLPAACEDTIDPPPKHVAYLMDTSGSMGERETSCPGSLGTPCRRIDVAHWAMRRMLPARAAVGSLIEQSGSSYSSGTTAFTGFIPGTQRDGITTDEVYNRIQGGSGIDVDVSVDPDEPDDTRYDTIQSDVESRLQHMCPNGWTPLGVHIDALARELDDVSRETGDPPDGKQPNKIVVISDGYSNKGASPYVLVDDYLTRYPHLQIDIIDVTGDNPALAQIARDTGGTYYSAEDPQELLDALFDSSGICGSFDLPMPDSDPRYCP
ncbi:MAG: VWA domain-containing protein [Alphaproteobacteria bacterium]|nr:VWA domain-containing protein [Alphaproteobacteria bacterium]